MRQHRNAQLANICPQQRDLFAGISHGAKKHRILSLYVKGTNYCEATRDLVFLVALEGDTLHSKRGCG